MGFHLLLKIIPLLEKWLCHLRFVSKQRGLRVGQVGMKWNKLVLCWRSGRWAMMHGGILLCPLYFCVFKKSHNKVVFFSQMSTFSFLSKLFFLPMFSANLGGRKADWRTTSAANWIVASAALGHLPRCVSSRSLQNVWPDTPVLFSVFLWTSWTFMLLYINSHAPTLSLLPWTNSPASIF